MVKLDVQELKRSRQEEDRARKEALYESMAKPGKEEEF